MALGRAVLLAAQAGEWGVVAELGRELAARRLERQALVPPPQLDKAWYAFQDLWEAVHGTP